MIDIYVEEGLRQDSPKTVDDLCERIHKYWPGADLSIIHKAHECAERAHSGQIRRSGEPYIYHPLGVAAILVDLKLDLATVAAGLLHDTVEDTPVTLDQIKTEFGDAVAGLVDGVTKISKMTFRNLHDKQGENIRKMIVAMGRDVRVILIKLADRLHNMRTLHHMAPEKQTQISQETIEIYAPLASRLGISSLKSELEDLSFKFLYSDTYFDLSQKVDKKKKERSHYIEQVKKILGEELAKSNFKCEVQGRWKHLWSIYRKIKVRNIDYEQVYDEVAFRVLVSTVSECYEVLGLVHSIWKPIPGRFKDFIAMPKANNYRSLHTTVIGPGGERIEIQIRTLEMHLIADRGIAAHWKYKEGGGAAKDISAQQFNWMRDLLNWHQTVGNPTEFLETIKTDLFDLEIYVFTPRGDVVELPEGATPIDFAYNIHTDVGNQCVGARVNGKMVPIKYRLQNGDAVEVVTSKTQTPSKDWLKFCVTNKAKNKIRWFVKNEQRKRALMVGKELLEKEFRKYGQSPIKYLKNELVNDFMKDIGVNDAEEIYIKIGYGKLEPKTVVARLAPNLVPQEDDKPNLMQRLISAATGKMRKTGSLIRVDGMGDILVHYSKCCHPIPGDPIVGFITRGRGITVHRANCDKAFEMDQMRRVEVEWSEESVGSIGNERIVRVRVVSDDRPGLLKLMSEAFSLHNINIHNAQIRTTRDKKAISIFDVSVKDASHLNMVLADLQKIKGVIAVTRMTHT